MEIFRKKLIRKSKSNAPFRRTGMSGMFGAVFAGLRWALPSCNESVNLLFEIREKNTYPKNER